MSRVSGSRAQLCILFGIFASCSAFFLQPTSLQAPMAHKMISHERLNRFTMSATVSGGSGAGSSVRGGGTGIEVQLGAYKNGALTINLPRPTVSEEEVAALVATRAKARYVLVPVRVVDEGGTKMGHSIICDFKATYMSGGDPAVVAANKLRAGMVLPRGDVKGFTLDLKEDQPEPLASFARAVAVGMGQMESKVFEVEMPQSVKIDSWKGVKASVMLLVRSINVKQDVAADDRPEEERKAEARAELLAKVEAAQSSDITAQFRDLLMETCVAHTQKMEESVSWAKFGERSLKDYQWQLIQETIATAEGIEFTQVPAFLRANNNIRYTDP